MGGSSGPAPEEAPKPTTRVDAALMAGHPIPERAALGREARITLPARGALRR